MSQWHGFSSQLLESQRLKVLIVPELGGRIVSIFDKAYQREWLLQPSRPPLLAPAGAKFTDYDPHGWDEMLPTIDTCLMPAGNAFAGQVLPDHGELWTLPWTVETHSDKITLRVRGKILPYELSRTAQLVDPHTLQLEYELHNLSDQTFPFLWTPHPLFAAQRSPMQTRIVLPESVTHVVNTSANEEWGEVGKRLEWPSAISTSGWLIDVVGDAARHSWRKVYLPPDGGVDHAELQDTSGATLRLAWQAAQLSYLGVWVDEGLFGAISNTALEPSNGFYDSLSRAWENNTATMLPPGTSLRWSLQVMVRG